jgi:hypothetical protein
MLYECVKELPHPLIPADAGIQTLPTARIFNRQSLGPRVRGDERMEKLGSSMRFLYGLYG